MQINDLKEDLINDLKQELKDYELKLKQQASVEYAVNSANEIVFKKHIIAIMEFQMYLSDTTIEILLLCDDLLDRLYKGCIYYTGEITAVQVDLIEFLLEQSIRRIVAEQNLWEELKQWLITRRIKIQKMII